LLPRFEESGEQDETSDIHISAHGLDCQIAGSAKGNLVISVSFSIYLLYAAKLGRADESGT